ncbi:MAG: hypothetical protein QOG53_1599 [Frankiales bacterium]|nr:hypothetical protein [Frankiales bacterium]
MGVLQRFERRLEGLVEGVFARAFRSSVQPVEIAGALQREMADRKAIVSQGRTLVPNQFVVELGSADHERLGGYAETLGEEFSGIVREHATEEGYAFVGPVHVGFELADDLDTGMFRVRSDVVRGAVDATQSAASSAASSRVPKLITAAGTGGETAYVLAAPVTVIGRAEDCDLRLADPGASRRHVEVRRDGDRVTVIDLRSTNGTVLNGETIERAELHDGDELVIGETVLVFRVPGAGEG